MPKVRYAHLCDYALASMDGKVSAMGLFSQINVVELPSIHPRAFLAFEIELQSAELGASHRVRIEFVDEDGKQLFRMEKEQVYDGPKRVGETTSAPEIVGLPPLPLEREGLHAVHIFLDDALCWTEHCRVRRTTRPRNT